MRIGFLCELNWSVHTVYDGLTKELHSHGIDTHIYHIEWNHNSQEYQSIYSLLEWFKIINNFDYIVAPAGPEFVKFYNKIGLAPEKTILAIHAPWEIPHMIDAFGPGYLDQYASIFSVSEQCIQNAKDLGVTADLNHTQNGVLFNRFYMPPSESCSEIGYAYPMNTQHKWKRTSIVSKINGGAVISADINHFSLMRQFYKNIDVSLWVSDETEAVGLVNMEAAAAGKLIMSTDVGIIKELPDNPMIKLRMDEEETIEDINNHVRFYRNNNELHRKKCIEIQEYAREYYDWSHAVKTWMTAFNKLNT